MRSEHKLNYDEQSAFTGWRRVIYWRPRERKAVNIHAHRLDRHTWRQRTKWDEP